MSKQISGFETLWFHSQLAYSISAAHVWKLQLYWWQSINLREEIWKLVMDFICSHWRLLITLWLLMPHCAAARSVTGQEKRRFCIFCFFSARSHTRTHTRSEESFATPTQSTTRLQSSTGWTLPPAWYLTGEKKMTPAVFLQVALPAAERSYPLSEQEEI